MTSKAPSFRFTDKDREILEEFGLGYPESSNAIGSPAQVADYISRAERHIARYADLPPQQSTSGGSLREIRTLMSHTEMLRESLARAHEATRDIIEGELLIQYLDSRPGSDPVECGESESLPDFDPTEDSQSDEFDRLDHLELNLEFLLNALKYAEYLKYPAAPPLEIATDPTGKSQTTYPSSYKKIGIGRPSNQREFGLACDIAYEYRGVFFKWPSTYVRGAFATTLTMAFETLGVSIDVHNLCRAALAEFM